MSNLSKEAISFCNTYQIRLKDDKQYIAKYQPIQYKSYTQSDEIYAHFEKEPLYILEVSHSALEEMARRDTQFSNEAELRRYHPAVRKAYEQYMLMVRLSQ